MSDTKLTSPTVERLGPTRGVMKTAIVTPRLCIGVAGNIYFADRALAELRSQKSERESDVLEVLRGAHNESRQDTDFIASFASSTPALFEIKNGSIKNTSTAWLGDKTAFEAYQERFHDAALFDRRSKNSPVSATFKAQKCLDQPGADNVTFCKMKEALSAVIADQCTDKVGDFVIPAAIDKGEWRYFDYAELLSHPIDWTKVLSPDGKPYTVQFGTAAEGGYGVNFISSGIESDYSTALFFPQGQFGIIFKPVNGGLGRPHVVPPSVTSIDFEEIAARDYYVTIRTMFSGADAYANRGWSRMQRGELSLALEDAENAIRLNPQEPKDRWKARYLRGCILMRREAYEAAERDLSDAIEIDNSSADCFNLRGVARGKKGRLKEAAEDFAAALKLNPDHTGAANNLTSVARLLRSI